jgi:O-antigen/teichoic acid export membrane protein
MSEYHNILAKVGLVGALNILVSLSTFILLPVMTKNVSNADYGIWVQVGVTVCLIPAVVMLGLPYTMVRFLAAEKNKAAIRDCFYSVTAVTAVTSAAVSLLFFAFSDWLSALLFAGNTSVMGFVAPVIVFECMNLLFVSYFRARVRIMKYTVLMLIKTYLNTATVALLVLSGYGLTGALAGFLATDAVMSVVMLAMIVREIGMAVPRFRNLREYLGFGLPTVPTNLSTWVITASDRYVIGGCLGTSFVGYYSAGYSLGYMIIMFVTPLSFLLPSFLSKCYDENNMADVRIILDRSFRYFLAIAIPSVFGLTILSKPVLEVLSTPEMASRGYLVTPLIAVSTLIFGIYTIVSQVPVLEKNTRIIGETWIAVAVLYFGMNLLAIPALGMIGAAMSSIVVYTLALLITVYFSRGSIRIDVDRAFVLKCVLSSAVMSVPIVILNPSGIAGIFVAMLIGVTVYVLALLLMKGIRGEELRLLKPLIKA